MTQSDRSLLLLGASGDLSGRLLLPAFGQLLDREESRRGVVLMGAGVEDWNADAWQQRVRTSFADGKVSDETLQSVLATTRYEQGRRDERGRPAIADRFLPAGARAVFCAASIGDRRGLQGAAAGVCCQQARTWCWRSRSAPIRRAPPV